MVAWKDKAGKEIKRRHVTSSERLLRFDTNWKYKESGRGNERINQSIIGSYAPPHLIGNICCYELYRLELVSLVLSSSPPHFYTKPHLHLFLFGYLMLL